MRRQAQNHPIAITTDIGRVVISLGGFIPAVKYTAPMPTKWPQTKQCPHPYAAADWWLRQPHLYKQLPLATGGVPAPGE